MQTFDTASGLRCLEFGKHLAAAVLSGTDSTTYTVRDIKQQFWRELTVHSQRCAWHWAAVLAGTDSARPTLYVTVAVLAGTTLYLAAAVLAGTDSVQPTLCVCFCISSCGLLWQFHLFVPEANCFRKKLRNIFLRARANSETFWETLKFTNVFATMFPL